MHQKTPKNWERPRKTTRRGDTSIGRSRVGWTLKLSYEPSPSMYWANYISKGLSWKMPMDGRPSKGCTAHGKAWNLMEGTRRYWIILDLCYQYLCLDD